MAATPSTMLPLGTVAPAFRLPNTDGRLVSLEDAAGAPAVLVAFLCNHCPYVRHIQSALVRLARVAQSRGLAVFAISSNDVGQFPEDGPEKMREEAATAGYGFPYLYDETQEVARAYRAACTPDFFLFDRGRRLVYRGQFDASRPGSGLTATGSDLRAAMEAVLADQPVPADQKPSIGCNIKWKPGNEPEYFGR